MLICINQQEQKKNTLLLIKPEEKKQHYEKHKDEVNKKLREKYTCPCGSVICVGERWSHEKTKKHTTLMQELGKI